MHAGQQLAARTVPMPLPPFILDLQSNRPGDVHPFYADRAPVEIVLGFRPGTDRVLITSSSPAVYSERLLVGEEGGNAVIVDSRSRTIVLHGVQLADIVPGDIEIATSRSPE
jgi:hypothetical protein